MDYDAVFLDAGGVLVLPAVDVFADALDEVGIAIPRDPQRFARAHYRGMAAIDSGAPGEEEAVRYLAALLRELGILPDALPVAAEGLKGLWTRPSSEVWSAVPPGTLDGLRELEATGVKLAIVSNSDGTIEESLRRLGLGQVGEGGGVGLSVVVDSFVVEAAKPKPEIFAHALRATGVPAERALHVGDGIRYDVEGARAAGVAAMHFDPFRLCPHRDHPHAAALRDVAEELRAAA